MPKAASIPAPCDGKAGFFSFAAHRRLAASALMLTVLVAVSITVTVRTDGFLPGLVLGGIGLVWLPSLVARFSEALGELDPSGRTDDAGAQDPANRALEGIRQLDRKVPVGVLYALGALSLFLVSYLASAALTN